MDIRTSIVIPNYNGEAYLRPCLDSLRRQTVPAEIIVVDNGSTDGSARLVAEEYPEVSLVRLPENTGFCGAVNTGIRCSDGMKYVILLNNDTTADPSFTSELIRAMEEDDSVFSCQAKRLKMDQPDLIDDAGDLYCALGWAFARGKGKHRDKYTRREEIFSACAGAAIYRKTILDEIGTFDENHFAYLEDCDIGWRARLYGYKNMFVPAALVYHVGSAASGSVYNLFKVRNTSRNSIYLISKNMPMWQILLNLPLLVPGFLVKAVFFAQKGFGGEYMKGIFRGFSLSEKGRKEGRRAHLKQAKAGVFLRIQLEMWINILRRFFR